MLYEGSGREIVAINPGSSSNYGEKGGSSVLYKQSPLIIEYEYDEWVGTLGTALPLSHAYIQALRS